jgi:hypothetical protein
VIETKKWQERLKTSSDKVSKQFDANLQGMNLYM